MGGVKGLVVNKCLTEDNVDGRADAPVHKAHVFDIFEVHEGTNLGDELAWQFVVQSLARLRDPVDAAIVLSGADLGGGIELAQLLVQSLVSHSVGLWFLVSSVFPGSLRYKTRSVEWRRRGCGGQTAFI